MLCCLPSGNRHGWGICGDYLRRELEGISDWPEGTVIQAITGPRMEPLEPQERGRINIGYTFFEDVRIAKSPVARENATKYWDWIVCGSTWCRDILRSTGYHNCSIGVQGVDPSLFHPEPAPRDSEDHRFIIFSGGKFELRKGQDILIRALRTFMMSNKDVWLHFEWSNPWLGSEGTMTMSPHISYHPGKYPDMRSLLADNGIPVCRTFCAPQTRHDERADLYRFGDIGVFPNRCEGGTNLVLMEYMACGKPVIASNSTGHRDVINPNSELTLPTEQMQNGWEETTVPELIAGLHVAYDDFHRNGGNGLKQEGIWNADAMKKWTWARLAKHFHDVAIELDRRQ